MNLGLFSVLFAFACSFSWATDENGPQEDPQDSRNGRLLSLFTIVSFRNEPCASASTLLGSRSRNGTCLTQSDCADSGGMVSGNCAAGFGVCCVFVLSGTTGTVTQNCTYIQNPGFPSSLTTTDSISYTVQKCASNVCDLRLDFETFSTVGLGDTLETAGTAGMCTDTFIVTSTGSTGDLVPTICGQNSGQHMYVNLGNMASDTATLAFTFSGTSTTRQFDIKVTQVLCGSPLSSPDTCLQYHVGTTGRIETFNFAPTAGETHLPNQRYSVCLRKEEGFCCVQYQACPNTDDAFTPSVKNNALTSIVDDCLTEDFIFIDGGSSQCTQSNFNSVVSSRFCGTFFNPQDGQTVNAPVCDCSCPFVVGVNFNADADTGVIAGDVNTNAIRSRGVCLEYMQIPCA